MKELLYFIITNIVEDKKSVRIDEKRQQDQVILNLFVAQKDMGRIIGKMGKTIRAIRNILTIRAIKDNVRIFLEVQSL